MGKKAHSKSNRSSDSKTIYYIFMFLIAAFMLLIPFYRGLFFRTGYIPAIAFVSIMFAGFSAYKLRDKTYKILDTYMDLSVLLLPAAYLISFFFAVNARDAMDMFLLYCSYFMLYKLISGLSAKDEKYKNIFINLLIASTFILSFASMLNVAGIVDIKGAFEGKRLFGLYQYANTTASVLGVGIILSLNKLISEGNTKKAAVYQLVLTALISAFIFTLSRGGYLVLAGVLLLNFLLIKARARLKLLLSIFISFLSSSVLIYEFYTLAEENISGIWIHYLISITASAIIIYIIYSFRNRVKIKFTEKSINIALITVVVIFTGISVFLFSVKEPIEYRIEHKAGEEKSWKNKSINLYGLEQDSQYTIEFDVRASIDNLNSYRIIIGSYNSMNEYSELFNFSEPTGYEYSPKNFKFITLEDTNEIRILLYNHETDSYTVYKNVVIKDSNGNIVKKMDKLKYVPEAIANRLADITWETENVSSRIYFTRDGLKIIKDYPIAGAGGGAWKNLYRQYQSMPYNTTEVHNFYVQYGTEVGIIGLAVLVGLLLLLIISMIKSIKSNSNYLYVYLATMLLLLHSTIDFNLSLAAVGYMLWLLVGIIGSERNTPLIQKLSQRYIGALVLALSLLIFFVSSSVYYGMKFGAQGAAISQENKDIDKAIEVYEKAATFDRYNGAYRIDLAQIMNNKLRETKDKKYYDGIMEQISLIRKYEPYNHQYTPIICSLYLSTGKFEEASKLADIKLQEEPLLSQSYSLKIDVNYELANYYLKENKIQEAIPYLEEIIEANGQFEKINKDLKTPLKLTEDYSKKFEAAQRTLDMIKADMKQ
ncbi:MAG: O-antigen ligase family protein [Clostridiaceae bacterium]|nr:O-antigen ligase family protein [Clostridiaceae bacterium]